MRFPLLHSSFRTAEWRLCWVILKSLEMAGNFDFHSILKAKWEGKVQKANFWVSLFKGRKRETGFQILKWLTWGRGVDFAQLFQSCNPAKSFWVIRWFSLLSPAACWVGKLPRSTGILISWFFTISNTIWSLLQFQKSAFPNGNKQPHWRQIQLNWLENCKLKSRGEIRC